MFYDSDLADPAHVVKVLQAAARRLCGYSPNKPVGGHGHRCDCKYGIARMTTESDLRFRCGEQTGCPELSMLARVFAKISAHQWTRAVRRVTHPKKERPLSEAQRSMLADTARGNPWLRIEGQAQHGGAHGTLFSLERRGLVGVAVGGYQLTSAGEAALEKSDPGLLAKIKRSAADRAAAPAARPGAAASARGRRRR